MNKYVILLTVIAVFGIIQAQTNSFPTNGNVGIGMTSPQTKVQVSGGGFSVTGTNAQSGVNGFKNFIQLTDLAHAAIIYNPEQANELMFGFHSNGRMYWGNGSAYAMRLESTGHLRIYTSLSIGGDLKSSSKMSVDGKLSAKEVQVTTSNWPDDVFYKDYQLMILDGVARFIEENGRLPDIPKAADVESNGVQLGEMVAKLLKKNEELTLHLIEKSGQLDTQKKQIDLLNIVLDEKLNSISLDR